MLALFLSEQTLQLPVLKRNLQHTSQQATIVSIEETPISDLEHFAYLVVRQDEAERLRQHAGKMLPRKCLLCLRIGCLETPLDVAVREAQAQQLADHAVGPLRALDWRFPLPA
jgi:hypothetical protein